MKVPSTSLLQMLQIATLLARSQTNMLTFETENDFANFDILYLKVFIVLSLLLTSK